MAVQRTRWGRVLTAFLAGCIGAAQVGKVAAALSLIIGEFDMSLVEGSLVVSLFSLMAAVTGVLFGMLADRFGALRLAVTGLAVCALASVLGARADSAATLFAFRALEGLGFILAIVSLPPLISQSASERDRPLAMGLWGAFMPAGIGMAMVAAPWLLGIGGWRGLWDIIGVVLLAWAILLAAVFRDLWSAHGGGGCGRWRDRLDAIATRESLVLFGCFACYSGLYVPLTSFFTTIAISDSGAALALASTIGAGVASANIAGNLAAGWLVRRGADPGRLLQVAFMAMGLFGCMVFAGASPLWLKGLAGVVFSACGGLVPGTLFILAPRFATHPARIAALSGVLLQGAGVGQALGPMLVGASVDFFGGWSWAVLNMALTAMLGMLMAFRVGAYARRPRG